MISRFVAQTTKLRTVSCNERSKLQEKDSGKGEDKVGSGQIESQLPMEHTKVVISREETDNEVTSSEEWAKQYMKIRK